MIETISIPYQSCNTLRRIRVEVTTEVATLLDSIWYDVPSLGDGEFRNLERFELAVRGK